MEKDLFVETIKADSAKKRTAKHRSMLLNIRVFYSFEQGFYFSTSFKKRKTLSSQNFRYIPKKFLTNTRINAKYEFKSQK